MRACNSRKLSEVAPVGASTVMTVTNEAFAGFKLANIPLLAFFPAIVEVGTSFA